MGIGNPSVHCPTAGEHWAVGLHQYIATLLVFSTLPHREPGLLPHAATLLGSSGQWDSFGIPPHCRGAVGSVTPVAHSDTLEEHWAVGLRHIVGEQWAVGLLHYTTALLGSSGQWNSISTPSPCWEPCTMGLLQYMATLLGSSGQWDSFSTLSQSWGSNGQCNSFSTMPHCSGVVCIGTPSIQCNSDGKVVGRETP